MLAVFPVMSLLTQEETGDFREEFNGTVGRKIVPLNSTSIY